MHLATQWTPMHAEALPAWGARALPPGPTVLSATAVLAEPESER